VTSLTNTVLELQWQ